VIDWDTDVLAAEHGVFGQPVTYMPAAGGASFIVTGVFDEAYKELDLAGGTATTTETPVLGVRASEFPAPPVQGDTLLIQSLGETFIVNDVRSDGHGEIKLMLNFWQ
jgi:hypothetical protein